MNNHLYSAFTLCAIASTFAIALLHSWTSRINQFFFFSRTVGAGFDQTEGARAITLTYRMRVWLVAGLAMLTFLILAIVGGLRGPGNLLLALVLQLLGGCTAFALAHRAAGKLIAAEPAASVELPEATVGGVPLLPAAEASSRHGLLLLAAVASAALAWGGSMLAAGRNMDQFMAAQEANKADFLCGFGAGLLFASVLLYVLIRYFSRHRTAFGNFTVSGAVQMAWLGAAALTAAAVTVPMQHVVTQLEKQVILGVVLCFAFLRLVYTWTRSRIFTPPQVERNGDQYWRLGMFYCNPSDPTLFIQHRSGPGYTVNFANFLSWPLTLLFVGNMVFLAVISSCR